MSYLIEQQDKANQNLEKTSYQSRIEDRSMWDKLLTVILGILGFSLTLFSTEFLSSRIMNSSAKYFLLSSWILYSGSLFVGFFLLKKETLFQRRESLRNTFYAMDTADFLDDRTLKVKEDKRGHFIALQVLRSKSIGSSGYWSEYALKMYENHKNDLNSYKMADKPEKLYSSLERKIIIWSERLFYLFIILATFSLIVSASFLIF